MWLLILLLFCCVAVPAESAKPSRIVSMNVCTDQLVLLLAEPERIVSLSFLAVDPDSSAIPEQAEDYHLNHGLTEQILPLNPDLVLTSVFSTRPTVYLLRKLGYRVVEIPFAADLDSIRATVRTVADAIDEVERGEKIIAEFDAKLPAASTQPAAEWPLAALYWANGYTSGKHSLASAALEAAGFRSLGVEMGLIGTAHVALEALVSAEIDVLIMGRQRPGAAQAYEVLRHPLLRQHFPDQRRVTIADQMWVCGTPFVVDAIAELAAFKAQHLQ